MQRLKLVLSGILGPAGHTGLFVMAVMVVLPGFQGFAAGTAGSEPQKTVEAFYGRFSDLMRQREALDSADFGRRFDHLLDGLFSIETLARKILEKRWNSLSELERHRFEEALRSSFRGKVLDLAEEHGADELPSLKLVSEEGSGTSVSLQYSVRVGGGGKGGARRTLRLSMVKSPAGEWKIADLEFDNKGLLERYGRSAGRLIERYSFNYMIAEIGDYPEMILEDFEGQQVDRVPSGWTWRDRDNDKNKPYRVREEDGNRYLAATDEGESVILGKDIKWNLRKYPYVSFRWRAHEIPEGADERFDKKVDSAAGIYFIYRKSLGLVPESVKYVWSSTLPVGSAVRRKGVGKPWMVVAESGSANIGEWHTYVFDLREAYKETFGHNPPSRPIGIGILSDANSMKAHAYADYDDIKALREVDGNVTGGVVKILPPGDK